MNTYSCNKNTIKTGTFMFIKTRLKKLDKQINIAKYGVAANIDLGLTHFFCKKIS